MTVQQEPALLSPRKRTIYIYDKGRPDLRRMGRVIGDYRSWYGGTTREVIDQMNDALGYIDPDQYAREYAV